MLSETIINTIIDHAEQGHQIAVITNHPHATIELIDNKVRVDVITHITRTNSQERIKFVNGAQITIHREPTGLRGRSVHLLVAPFAVLNHRDNLADIAPALAITSGELLGYFPNA